MKLFGPLLLLLLTNLFTHTQTPAVRRSGPTTGTTERPNILWITCEDMSAHLPSYGDKTVPTPNIDRLAREGVRYRRIICYQRRVRAQPLVYHHGYVSQ